MTTMTPPAEPRAALRVAPRRPVRIQVCLTPDERAQLTERARTTGHESVAAYVRASALGEKRTHAHD